TEAGKRLRLCWPRPMLRINDRSVNPMPQGAEVNAGIMNPPHLYVLVEEALDAFWDAVIRRYPDVTSGDLSPEATTTLNLAAKAAIKEWLDNNAKQAEATAE